MEWIKIADQEPPKDGTRFIIYKPKYIRSDKRDGYAFTAVVFYRIEDDIHPDYIGDIEECSEDDLVVVSRLLTAYSHHYITAGFTHWMPLPEPPKEVNGR